MGKDDRTKINVVTFFDGNVPASDVFADIIAFQYQRHHGRHGNGKADRQVNGDSESAYKNEGNCGDNGNSNDGNKDNGEGNVDRKENFPANHIANGREMEYNDKEVQIDPEPASRLCG